MASLGEEVPQPPKPAAETERGGLIVADCSKTAEFLREWDRMCLGHSCEDCKMSKYNNETGLPCGSMPRKRPNRAIAIVQEWSDEHPVMTWESKLKELLPNVDMSKIIGTCCPYNLLGGKAPNMETCRSSGDYEDCVNCWLSEYKEE